MNFDEAKRELARIDRELNERYRGKEAVIVSNYNGQPHGFSRKSLTGKRVTIEHIHLFGGFIEVFVKGQSLGLKTDELQLVDAGGAQ